MFFISKIRQCVILSHSRDSLSKKKCHENSFGLIFVIFMIKRYQRSVS